MVVSAKLSRKPDQARLLIKSQATALVMHEKLDTTKAKAKALVPYFERLVTRAKRQNLASFRYLRAHLDTEVAARKLYDDLVPRYQGRQGGYTQLKAAGWRLGDNSRLYSVTLTAAAKVAKPTAKATTPKTSTPKTSTAQAKS